MEHAGGSAHTRPDDGDAPENVIRITASGKERHYISYANGLLLEKGHSTVVLTAMGSVINKCITVAEILKRQVAGLHQWNQIKSIMLEKQMGSRPVSHMTITLSLAPDALEQSDVFGYQPPLPLDLVNPAPHHGVRKGPQDGHSPPNGGLGGAGAGRMGARSRGGKGGGRGRGRGDGKASPSTE